MNKIACVGDSITWGFTILRRSKYSYPSVLQSLLEDKAEVGNFGLNDATASLDSEMPYARRSTFKKALDFHPDMVLMMLGSNDSKKINWNEKNFREGYLFILEKFMDMGAKPYLLLPPAVLNRIEIKQGVQIGRLEPKFLALDETTLTGSVIPVIKDIASTLSLPVIDLHSVVDDISLFNDGIHPNRTGAALMAETVFSQLKTSLL